MRVCECAQWAHTRTHTRAFVREARLSRVCADAVVCVRDACVPECASSQWLGYPERFPKDDPTRTHVRTHSRVRARDQSIQIKLNLFLFISGAIRPFTIV